MAKTLKVADLEVYQLIIQEKKRQRDFLEMIPSENYASKAVNEAAGSALGNMYAEGYPGKRYYQGNGVVDRIETLAIERLKKLFGVPYVNVQPYSGSPANSEIYFALLEPGDKLMGLALSSGGHLTHGHPKVTFSGRYFNSVQYVVEDNGWIDYDKLAAQVLAEKPKILVAGTTSYPRVLEFEKFRRIADSVGAILMADISHITGLVLAGVHPNPVPFCDVIMSTTHKTFRGPRGAMILVTERGIERDPEMGEKIDKAVIPGLQGGPHENVIAGIAIAAKEAESEEFKKYNQQVVKNAAVLAKTLIDSGVELVSGGTDNHLMVIDLKKRKLSGNVVAQALEEAGIVANKNAVPGDQLTPFYSSGVRLGTPALTTRGMGEEDMVRIGKWITEVINLVDSYDDVSQMLDKEKRVEYYKKTIAKVRSSKRIKQIKKEITTFARSFPTEF
jgi:glycine hydroxymethyltransferase